MTNGERADVERLRVYWDGVVQGDPTVPDDLDPETAAMVRQLHTWYRRSQPDPAFRVRLEEELMQSLAISPLTVVSHAPRPAGRFPVSPNGRTTSVARCRLPFCSPPGSGQLLGYLASAALVLVTLVAAYLAFGPARPEETRTGRPANLPALLAPATPASGEMTEGIVLQMTNFGIAEELPEAPVSVHLDRIELPPGASSSSSASDLGLGAYVIESGTATFTPTEDIELFQDGQPHGVTFGGDETQLEPGEGFVLEPNIGGELRNDGTEPVVVVVIRMIPGTPEEPASAPGL